MSHMVENPEVLRMIETYPDELRSALLELRSIIFETAEQNDNVGVLEETLKWGQPSYLTVRPKSGTTIRIDQDKSDSGDYAFYVNCQSSLVSEWRAMYPHLIFGGDRSVHFRLDGPIPKEEISQMITMALTYHVGKRGRAKR
ncbi:hypothetical protein LP7551_02239 [Roseibium album]|nr:hypothetical protein LP7551_02239 [Roseibium album]